MRTKNVSILLFVVMLCLVGCTASPTPAQPTAEPGIPNPASVYCEERGGLLEIRTEDDGGQYGVCIFADDSECEEWAFFYGKCAPKETEIIGMPNPASVYCEEQGGERRKSAPRTTVGSTAYVSSPTAGGGKTEIRTEDDGGQYGVCIFPDGSECEEWAFFHGECAPGMAETQIANPASIFCKEQGGQLETRTGDDGGEYGVCIFPDGSECEEWAFFRGECKPGEWVITQYQKEHPAEP